MPNYHIYGVGAALVDTEILVTDEFLEANQIEKGLMTLVDEDRQQSIIQAIQDANHHVKRASGGSACNTVVAAAQLGANAFYSAKVAADEDGDFFVNDLKEAGVAFHDLEAESGTTGKCLVMITPDAERSMNTYLGASVDYTTRETDFTALEQSQWLYLEGYLVTDDSRTAAAAAIMQYAKKHGVKTALSLSDPFVVEVFKNNLLKVMNGKIDMLFCNAAEAMAFTGMKNVQDAAMTLQHQAKCFAITMGKQGAMVFDGSTLIHTPGNEVDAIDTNGAGDMFAGAFLAGISLGKNFKEAAELANEAAARVVAQFGPRLEPLHFDQLRQEFNL
jgi:sugar/nucleoside kinase (ribokinase family)